MQPLYTTNLTPRLDVPEEVWRIVFEGEEMPRPTAHRGHYERLDADDRKAVVAYCEELDCLHEDLQFILEELDQSVKTLYANSLHLKRLAIVYHLDNFYFRVHAYREKVFKLVNHFLSLQVQDDEAGFNGRLLSTLRLTGRALRGYSAASTAIPASRQRSSSVIFSFMPSRGASGRRSLLVVA